jgi:hypothetical protein
MNTTRKTITALAAASILAMQLAVVGSAEAKSAKCVSTPVPGKVATFVVTCSTKRP